MDLEQAWNRIGGLLTGEVAVVTGGGRGNGEGIARGLARAGAVVAVLDVDEWAAAAVADDIGKQGGTAKSFAADITDVAACEAAAEAVRAEFGDVSILVNNAGILHRFNVDDPEFLGSFETQYKVNVLGSVHMVHALVKQLLATGGTIINVGSTASFRSPPKGTGYTASKGAVLQLTRGLAAELGPRGVRVNAIAPGAILTRMTEDLQNDPDKRDWVINRTPLRKFGTPQDLAGVAVLLASQLSSHVAGVMVPVDGGVTAQ